MFLDLSQ